MGCCGSGRDKKLEVLREHKFDYLNLGDFNSKLWTDAAAYIWIYMGTLISIACYAADLYTAIILLVYNGWTNSLLRSSVINFNVAKIIFCVCIILSFVLLAIDWYFAIRVIKSDGVAEAYMNMIAVRFNCIRGGNAKHDTGWKRYLVFSRLTKSRGLVDYIALFTYFAFNGWIRIIFAEGPRVVINTLTFISVTKADTIHQKSALGYMDKFGQNVSVLYEENMYQVFILGTMAFTTVMWILAVTRLLVASFLYMCFLWHAVGRSSLKIYCKARIDARMSEIVLKKHNKALRLEKEQNAYLHREPTIPCLAAVKENRRIVDPMSSTVNLLPRTSTNASFTPSLSREPTIPNLPELSNQSRNYIPNPYQNVPRPGTAGTTGTIGTGTTATTESTRTDTNFSPPGNLRPPRTDNFPSSIEPHSANKQQKIHGAPYGGYGPPSAEGAYRTRPLPPVIAGTAPFGSDILQRNINSNNSHGPLPMPMPVLMPMSSNKGYPGDAGSHVDRPGYRITQADNPGYPNDPNMHPNHPSALQQGWTSPLSRKPSASHVTQLQQGSNELSQNRPQPRNYSSRPPLVDHLPRSLTDGYKPSPARSAAGPPYYTRDGVVATLKRAETAPPYPESAYPAPPMGQSSRSDHTARSRLEDPVPMRAGTAPPDYSRINAAKPALKRADTVLPPLPMAEPMAENTPPVQPMSQTSRSSHTAVRHSDREYPELYQPNRPRRQVPMGSRGTPIPSDYTRDSNGMSSSQGAHNVGLPPLKPHVTRDFSTGRTYDRGYLEHSALRSRLPPVPMPEIPDDVEPRGGQLPRAATFGPKHPNRPNYPNGPNQPSG